MKLVQNVLFIYFAVPYTPVPQSFWLILHSSEARFISSGHLRKTIVSQSDESDLCLSTISGQSDVCGRDLMRRKCPDDGTKCRSDTDLIVDKHKSDSSDCDTIVFGRWPEEINLASDEWRLSQKLCGTGVLVFLNFIIIIYYVIMWTALLKVTNDIFMALDKRYCVFLVLLDLSAAFDTINHDMFFAKACNGVCYNGISSHMDTIVSCK